MSTTEAGRPTATKPDGSDGLSFQAVIETARRLDELSCARVIAHVADQVHAAQHAGQPLGTVTPAAILVAPDGSVRFAPGAGAARYTAPEKLRGGAGDRRSDVFSLGVVLWEALAHERLFDGVGDEAIRRAVLAGALRLPSEYNANVPAELDAICQRALAAEPASRYQSAKVMAAEIDAVLGDAGYPESNEAIASYVARAAGASNALASKPVAPGGKTAPMPATGPAPAPRPASRTLQPMSLAAPRPASSMQPPAAAPSRQPSGSPLSSVTQPAARSANATEPPRKAAASAAMPGTLRSSSATQPPPASTFLPASVASATQPPAPANSGVAPAPPVASATHPPAPTSSGPASSALIASVTRPPAPASSAASSSVWTSPTGISPTPFIANRPPAQTVTVGSWDEPEPPTTIDAKPPAWDDASARTEVRRSMSPSAGGATRSALASTAFLGSNASASPGSAGGTHVGVPPALVFPAPSSRTKHGAAAELPSFAPPEMPASRGSPPPSDPKPALPTPFGPGHPQPPLKESIATAATAETPHLAVEPLPAYAVSTQLGLAPGKMIAPAAPSKAMPTADNEFEDERHADPAEVIALQQPDKGRDVLAGWGWSTGATEAITDDEDLHDTTRAGRKRLVLTIGIALAALVAISVVAFVFFGSKQPADDRAAAPRPPALASTTAAVASTTAAPASTAAAPASATAPVAGLATPPSTGSVTPAPAATPTPAEARPGSDPTPAVVVDPPRPVVVDPPRPVVADSPRPVVVDPPRPIVAEPPGPIADSAKPVAAPAAKHDPPKLAAAKPPEAAKPTSRKSTEPKKPIETVKHAPAPERGARVQLIDPYGGAPDKPRPDPVAAYRSGLQQYARGDTSGALATLRSSLSSNPGYAPTWRGIGLVYEKLGNKGQARSAFKRYLQLSPGASDADQIRDRLERLGS